MRAFFAFSLVCSLACAGIEPTEGTYVVEASDVELSDGCDAWGITVDEDDFELDVTVHDDTIDLGDVFEDCERDGAGFSCEREETSSGGGITTTAAWTAAGNWNSSTTFEAGVEQVFTCEGDSCGTLDTCEITSTWAGELDE